MNVAPKDALCSSLSFGSLLVRKCSLLFLLLKFCHQSAKSAKRAKPSQKSQSAKSAKAPKAPKRQKRQSAKSPKVPKEPKCQSAKAPKAPKSHPQDPISSHLHSMATLQQIVYCSFVETQPHSDTLPCKAAEAGEAEPCPPTLLFFFLLLLELQDFGPA
jgi:type IV secretory pathway VirB10-like protein